MPVNTSQSKSLLLLAGTQSMWYSNKRIILSFDAQVFREPLKKLVCLIVPNLIGSMSRSCWSMFIGYLCAFTYTCLTLYLFTGLIGVHDIGSDVKTEENEKVDPDTIDTSTDVELSKFTRKQVAAFTIKFVDHIAMMIASILFIVGVKKQRHSFMAPLIYICGFSMLINLVTMFIDVQSTNVFILEFLAFVLAVGVWYPIFRHYRKVKKSHCNQKSVEAAAANCVLNPPSAPYYAHDNAYPCAPSSIEFVHSAAVDPTAPLNH